MRGMDEVDEGGGTAFGITILGEESKVMKGRDYMEEN